MSSLLTSISYSDVSFTNLMAVPRVPDVSNFRSMETNNSLQCPQEVRQFIPAIARMIWSYMADNANGNNFKGIHYNMLIAGNGSNPELYILVTFVANNAYRAWKNQTFSSYEQAVTQMIPWIVDRRRNFITLNNEQLANSAFEHIGTIRQYAQEYVNEAAGVSEFMAATYMGGTVSANVGFQNGGGGYSGGGSMSGFGQPAQPQSMQSNFSHSGGGVISGFGGGGGNARPGDAGSVFTRVDAAGASAFLSRDDRAKEDLAATLVIKPTKKAVAEQALDPVNKERQRLKDIEELWKKLVNEKGQLVPEVCKQLQVTTESWRSNPFQTYPYAFDSAKFVQINRLVPSKDGKFNYVISTLERNTMDRSAHTLPTSEVFLGQLSSSKGTRAEQKEKALQAATASVSEARKHDGEADYVSRLSDLREVGHVVMKEPVHCISQALSFARQASMIYSTGEMGSHTMECVLAKDFILCRKDHTEFASIDKLKTFAAVASRIRSVIEDSTKSATLRVAMVQLNAYLAECFVEWIRFHLCLDDYANSTSFMDDVAPMVDDIAQSHGKPHRDTLMSAPAQERFLSTYLVFGDAYESSLQQVMLNDGDSVEEVQVKDDNTVVVQPVVTPCLFTSTEFLDSEFGLEVPSETAAMFTNATTTEALYKLVAEFVQKNNSAGLQAVIRRFFLTTLDEKVYEVNVGLGLTSAPLLIRKVK